MVVLIGDDNVQRLSSTATTPSAVMSLVADAPKSIKTMTIYSKYFTVAFDSIPGLILRIIPTGAYHIWEMQATYHRFDGICLETRLIDGIFFSGGGCATQEYAKHVHDM